MFITKQVQILALALALMFAGATAAQADCQKSSHGKAGKSEYKEKHRLGHGSYKHSGSEKSYKCPVTGKTLHGSESVLGTHLAYMLIRDAELREHVGLKDEQLEKIKSVSNDYRIESIRTQSELNISELELGSLRAAETVDRKAVEEKIDEIAALNAKAMKSEVRFIADIETILTPGQLEKAEAAVLEALHSTAKTAEHSGMKEKCKTCMAKCPMMKEGHSM